MMLMAKAGVAGALKAGNLLSAEADAELSPGHAREQKINRGQHPQGVRRGCTKGRQSTTQQAACGIATKG